MFMSILKIKYSYSWRQSANIRARLHAETFTTSANITFGAGYVSCKIQLFTKLTRAGYTSCWRGTQREVKCLGRFANSIIPGRRISFCSRLPPILFSSPSLSSSAFVVVGRRSGIPWRDGIRQSVVTPDVIARGPKKRFARAAFYIKPAPHFSTDYLFLSLPHAFPDLI